MLRTALLVLLPATAMAQAIQCPPSITVVEKASPVSGWRTPETKSEKPFERISIYNGDDGGREYELAPPEQKESGRQITQTWPLKDYRDMNLFLRCRYRETLAVLSLDLPPGIAACTFTFTLDARSRVSSKPSMLCK